MNRWTKEWPTKIGCYWFYGYRYGKFSCGFKQKPEMILVSVKKISNGVVIVGNGQFVEKSEPEEAHFMKATLPKPPDIGEINHD